METTEKTEYTSPSGQSFRISWTRTEDFVKNTPTESLKNVALDIAKTVTDPSKISSKLSEQIWNHGKIKSAGCWFTIDPMVKILVETDYPVNRKTWSEYLLPDTDDRQTLIRSYVDFYAGKDKNWFEFPG